MIRSMTGYGRAETTGERFTVTAEARSLNHRHLDLALKLPRSLSSIELEARRLVQGQVQRGRLDVTVELRSLTTAGQTKVDPVRAREYAELARALGAEVGVPGTLTLEWLLERPGVVVLDEPEPIAPDQIWPLVAEALTRAFATLTARRETEGEALAKAVSELHDLLTDEVERMAARAPVALERQAAELRERIKRLLGDVALDEGRLAMEVALLSERSDITEELARLRAHLDHFAALVREGGAVGRTLEFVIQELNREVNTVASKGDDLELSQSAIAAKGLIEKLREHAQNIE